VAEWDEAVADLTEGVVRDIAAESMTGGKILTAVTASVLARINAVADQLAAAIGAHLQDALAVITEAAPSVPHSMDPTILLAAGPQAVAAHARYAVARAVVDEATAPAGRLAVLNGYTVVPSGGVVDASAALVLRWVRPDVKEVIAVPDWAYFLAGRGTNRGAAMSPFGTVPIDNAVWLLNHGGSTALASPGEHRRRIEELDSAWRALHAREPRGVRAAS
jgi:hypothetical protein